MKKIFSLFLIILIVTFSGCRDNPTSTEVDDLYKIAFLNDRSLYTINLDGTDLTEIYKLPSTPTIFSLSWSPNGEFIKTHVYGGAPGIINVKDPDYQSFNEIPGIASWFNSVHLTFSKYDSIYVQNILSGESYTIGEGSSPKISPDERKIAFVKSGNLYVMNSDGTQAQHLADSVEGTNLTWSPNSEHVAFLRAGSLWSINLENGRIQQLVKDKVAGGIFRPVSWSPDGSKLAYLHGTASSGPYRIGVVNADGTGNVVVLDVDDNVIDLKWFPDINRNVILYRSGSNGMLMKVNPDGSNPVEITALDDIFTVSPIPINLD